MRSRYLVALLLLLATACSKQDGSQAKFDSRSGHTDVGSAAIENNDWTAVTPVVFKQPASLAVQEPESDDDSKAEQEQDDKSAASEFKRLNKEMSEAMKEFTAKRRAARSREEFDELMKSNPMEKLGQQFVEFAKEFKGTPQAQSALMTAAGRGIGEAKTKATEMLMEIVESDPDSKKMMGPLRVVASQGEGDLKSKAMAMLFESTIEDPDSKASRDVLSMLAFLRGEDESKSKAIAQLFKAIDADPGSGDSLEQLVKFATRGDGEGKTRAIGVLVDKHVNDDSMVGVMTTMSRGMPSPEAYEMLKSISEKAIAPNIKSSAIFGRIAMLDSLKRYKTLVANADEALLESLGPEVVEFIKSDPGSKEMASLEKMLEEFVKENKGLLDKAEKELFAIKYLSVGKEAPEIVGLDLDGVEFKLSDYRGKVVFLDFWGDW